MWITKNSFATLTWTPPCALHGSGRIKIHIFLLQCGTESQFGPFAEVAVRQQAGNYLKLKVEILRLNGAAPDVLHSFRHTSSSVTAVRESMKGVTQSPAWPPEANAFRIVSEDGVKLYRWPERGPDVTKTPRLN
jgi:hypothetical protein